MNKLLILASLLFLFSCNNKEENKRNMFKNYIENITETKLTNGNYLIISNSSCGSCVKKIYAILEKEKTLIILTESMKVDSVRIINNFENFTIIFDKKNLFYNKKNEEIATYEPIYLQVQNKKIKHILSFEISERDRNFFNLADIASGYY